MKRVHQVYMLFMLIFSLVLTGFSQNDKQITLEDIYKDGIFNAKSVHGLRSMKDGVHYTTIENGKHLVKFNYKTGEVKDTLFNAENHDDISGFFTYVFSDDESKLLIATDRNQIYRHSFTAQYYVYDREQETLEQLSENGAQRLATFSPDASKIGFVRKNNLFYKDLESGAEIQVTDDGKHNHIINGTTDWVYEEEFAFTQGFHWSPNSDKIAFYKFDESRVKEFHMNMFKNQLYPEDYTFKYPKAGEKNAIVDIFVYELGKETTKEMNTGEETDQYIPRIKWTKDNNTLSMIRMNRLQNHVEILFADATNGKTEVIYDEKNEHYISEINDNYPVFLDDGEHFILYSEKSGHNHLYLYDTEGNLQNQITGGDWSVTDILGVDEDEQQVYYSSTEVSPLQRHTYSIGLDGKNKTQITEKKGWNRVDFSNGFKYFINYHSDANTPTEITLHNEEGEEIRMLENNDELKEKAEEYGFVEKEFMKIKTPSSKWDLNGYIMKPNDFDPDKEYPLFMFQYSGPGSQQVTERWDRYHAWFTMLTQKGYVVAVVDGRGTGARGEKFKKMTYGELGKYETVDQIEAAQYLGDLPYIDEDRTGIYGWSYGGFMAANCLFQGNDVFSMAISVAPVTNWRYYDTIYTERYMGLPQDNAEGYDDNSPINHVDKMKGAFLLVHGTGDDNVHFQNSIELSEKLVQANKQFDQQFYPDKNHGIHGGNTSVHLFTKMTNFIEENL
ncbi:MAG: S9 family peptidase [Bacteroidales bacterium]